MSNTLKSEDLRLNIIVNGDPARKELIELEKSTRDLKQTNKDLRLEKSKLSKKDKDYLVDVRKLNDAIKANNDTLKKNATRMSELRNKIGITSLSLLELKKRARELRWSIERMTPGDPRRKKLEIELAQINRQMTKVSIGANRAGMSLKKMGGDFRSSFAKITAGIFALTGVFYAFKGWVNKLVGFEDQVANIMKTTGLTRKAVRELTSEFKYLNTRTSRKELMLLAEEAGRLGKKSKQDVLDFIEVANQLKIALGDDLGDSAEEAIREVGKLTNIYKVGEKYGIGFKDSMLKIGSAINEVSANSQAMAPYLIDTLKRMGGLADQAGIMAQDVIGYGSALDQLGQRVEMSTTALNKVILNMFTDTSTYAEIAKMELQEFTDLLNNDANEAFLKVLKGLNGNNDGLAVMGTKLKELGLDGSRSVQVLAALAGNIDMITEAQELANTALIEGTSLTDEYNIKNENFAGSVSKMGIAWDNFIISVSESDGVLKKSFDAITGFINWVTEITVDDEKNLEKFRRNQNDFHDMSAFNAVRLAGLATELMKKQHEVRGQDKNSIKDWIWYYTQSLNELEGNDSKYAENKKLLYKRQIHDLKGFMWEQKEILTGDGENNLLGPPPPPDYDYKAVVVTLESLNEELKTLKEQYNKIDLSDKQALATNLEKRKSIQKIIDQYTKLGKEKKKALIGPVQDPYLKMLNKKAEILAKYREEDLQEIQDNYERDKILRKTAHFNQLAALGDNEEEKAKLKEEYRKQELAAELKHLIILQTALEVQLSTSEGGMIGNALLSDEDKINLENKLIELQSVIAVLKAEITEEETNADDAGVVAKYLLGDDWDTMKLADKIQAVGNLVINTLNDINKIISNAENQQMMDFRKNVSDKKTLLNKQLNDGAISYEEYTARTAQLDEDLDKKKRKIDHDQAVRAKALAIMSTILSTAAGVARAFEDYEWPISMAVAAIVGALGAVQIGVAASQPVPAYGTGTYQQLLASDGKKYRARVTDSKHKSGLFNKPTYRPGFGLFGETADPELVFNPKDTEAIMNTPALIDAINNTIGVRAFGNGNAREMITNNNTVEKTFTDPAMLDMMAAITAYMKNPPLAKLVTDEEYIRTHQEEVGKYDEFQERVS